MGNLTGVRCFASDYSEHSEYSCYVHKYYRHHHLYTRCSQMIFWTIKKTAEKLLAE